MAHKSFLPLLMMPLIFCIPQDAAAESAWLLQQVNTQAGKQTSLISPSALKLTTKSVNILMKAPKYDAIIYNESSHKFVELTYDKWTNRYKRDPHNAVASATRTGKTQTIAGWKTEQYTRKMFHQHGDREEIWVSKDIAPQARFADVALTALRLPTGLGMPIRVQTFRGDKLLSTTVDTIGCRKVKIKDSDFALPKGYTRAKNEIEVLLDSSQSEDISDMLLSR